MGVERFILGLGRARTPDDPVRLWRQGEGGAATPPEILRLREVAERGGLGASVTVTVPSEDVLLTPVALPVRGKRQILQALPYALEEHLVEDIETQVWVLAEEREDDGHWVAAVCQRESLDFWQSLLDACGINPLALVPDVLVLPWRPGCWTVARDGERVLVRYGRALGSAVPPQILGFYLSRLEQEERRRGAPPTLIDVYGIDELPVSAVPVDIPQEHHGETWHPASETARPVVDLRATNAARRTLSRDRWRPWRTSLVLAAAWLFVLWVRLLVDVIQLGHERELLSRQITTLFHETFPHETHLVDARVQMMRGLHRLEQETATGGWTRLLASVAIARPPGLRVLSMSYRAGRLTVSLSDAAESDLISFLHRLQQAKGTRVHTEGLTTVKGVTRARVILERTGD